MMWDFRSENEFSKRLNWHWKIREMFTSERLFITKFDMYKNGSRLWIIFRYVGEIQGRAELNLFRIDEAVSYYIWSRWPNFSHSPHIAPPAS